MIEDRAIVTVWNADGKSYESIKWYYFQ